MSTNPDSGLYQEHDFVIVESISGKQVRIPFGEQTLEEFRERVAKELYPHLCKETSANATPQILRLIWCGKEIEPGCMWHCGTIKDEDVKMKVLNPNCKDGTPMILAHATGGTDYMDEEEEDDEHDHSQPSTMNNIKYSHSTF